MNSDTPGPTLASRFWHRQSLLAEFLLVALPKILNGVGLILINALALQVFGPATFGVFALCNTVILLVDGVLGSAFDMGVVRLVTELKQQDRALARNIESAALFLKSSIAVAIGLSLLPLASWLAEAAFEMPGRSDLIHYCCLAAISLLALRSVQVHLQVNERFATYGALDLLTSVLRIGGVIGVLYWMVPDPAYPLIVLAAAPGLAFVIGIFWLSPGLVQIRPGFGPAAKQLMSFVKWTLATFCITTVAAKVDLLLLSAWSSIDEVGLFAAGHVLTMIPELLGMYLAVVVSPKIMPAIAAGTFPAMLRRFQGFAMLAALVGLIVGLASLGLISNHFLPEEYRRSATILGILLPGALLSMANFPLVVPTVMFVRPRVLVVIELVLMPPMIIAYYFAIQHGGAEGAAVVTTCGRTLKALVQLYAAWRFCSAPPDHESASLSGSEVPS